MKPFEALYLALEPFLLPLHRTVRGRLRRLVRNLPMPRPEILDVGGRKSHCTIGIPAHVTISDLPRTTALQRELHLGLSEDLVSQLRRRRSNLRGVVFDDMTRSAFASRSFDVVLSVEVIEHVVEDEMFVREVARVLKPGGVYLLTTPNGDWRPDHTGNPDHVRHYRREQLGDLLRRHFDTVTLEYAVKAGRFHDLGLRSMSLKRPVETVTTMAANFLNSIESGRGRVQDQASETHHLIAVARRDGPGRAPDPRSGSEENRQ